CTFETASANVPVPCSWVQFADVRSTRYSPQAWNGGIRPTLYCHTLGLTWNVSRPSPKCISSGWLSPTSSSHTRTCVMPAAIQSPVYSGPVDFAPRFEAVEVLTSRNP